MVILIVDLVPQDPTQGRSEDAFHDEVARQSVERYKFVYKYLLVAVLRLELLPLTVTAATRQQEIACNRRF
jgi:hypothetical protein